MRKYRAFKHHPAEHQLLFTLLTHDCCARPDTIHIISLLMTRERWTSFRMIKRWHEERRWNIWWTGANWTRQHRRPSLTSGDTSPPTLLFTLTALLWRLSRAPRGCMSPITKPGPTTCSILTGKEALLSLVEESTSSPLSSSPLCTAWETRWIPCGRRTAMFQIIRTCKRWWEPQRSLLLPWLQLRLWPAAAVGQKPIESIPTTVSSQGTRYWSIRNRTSWWTKKASSPLSSDRTSDTIESTIVSLAGLDYAGLRTTAYLHIF